MLLLVLSVHTNSLTYKLVIKRQCGCVDYFENIHNKLSVIQKGLPDVAGANFVKTDVNTVLIKGGWK